MRKQPAPDVASFASPEREALAHAIAAHAAAAAEVAATDEAGRRASEAVWTAQDAATAAQEVVSEAREATARHMVAAVSGADDAPPQTERQARAALAAAEATLEDARNARDALKGRLPDAERVRDNADRALKAAARAVIAVEAADHAAALVSEVRRLQDEVMQKGAVLVWLIQAGALPVIREPGFLFGMPVDPSSRNVVTRHQDITPVWSQNGWIRTTMDEGATPWAAAQAALERDATAPLPGPQHSRQGMT